MAEKKEFPRHVYVDGRGLQDETATTEWARDARTGRIVWRKAASLERRGRWQPLGAPHILPWDVKEEELPEIPALGPEWD